MQGRALEAEVASGPDERKAEPRRDLGADVTAVGVGASPPRQDEVEVARGEQRAGECPPDVEGVRRRVVDQQPVARDVGLDRGGHRVAHDALGGGRPEGDDGDGAVTDCCRELAGLRDGASAERVEHEVVVGARRCVGRCRTHVPDRLGEGGDPHAAAA